MQHIINIYNQFRLKVLLLLLTVAAGVTSCIEPPLKLPAQEVLVDLPLVVTDIDVVWDVDVDWEHDWFYGWDKEDERLWGPIAYPYPTNFEVRRYFLGNTPNVAHNQVDGFTIYGKSFKRTYEFGYYDMLVWSNIDSEDGTQVVLVNEDNLDEVTATTTVSRALALSRTESRANALYNQPEVFYSAYPRNIFISRNMEDYDYFDEQQNVWVKHVNCTLEPLVYIYLVQIILYNNDGRVRSINGDCAISAFASGTSVNTAHTFNDPCMVYFNTRLKRNLPVKGRTADVIGGKLTTYGLCDMEGYHADSRAEYHGSRSELPNYLYFELNMSNGSVQSIRREVTRQCQAQCHGGIITIEIDCNELDNPVVDGQGSLFHPVVEDYEELIFDIPIG